MNKLTRLDKFVLKCAVVAVLLAIAAVCSPGVWAQNLGVTLFPSAARTATTLNSTDQVNNAGRGVTCVLDTTVYTSGNVTLTIQGKDGASGKYFTLLAGAAVSSVSTNVYKVFPGAPVTANVSANDQLTRAWRVTLAGAASPNATYSVGCSVQ